MIKHLAAATLLGGLAGCTPTDLTRPLFPAVPPAQTEPRPDDGAAPSSRPRPPVTPAQVTDRSAREILKNLEAELERDASEPAPNP